LGQLTEREDEWQRRATAAAIAAVRRLTRGANAAINENMPVGRLKDHQFGWIAAAAIFAWLATRAEQAASESLDVERVIRASAFDSNPWDAGAVAAILPRLAQADFDWTKPFLAWPRETAIEFLVEALKLVRLGIVARDLGSSGGAVITRKGGDGKLDDSVSSWA
jgi:hypothetical protein